MRYTTVIAVMLSAAPLALAQDDKQSYLDSVCSPSDSGDSTVIPPCISVQNIESLCAPRGKTPADFLDSQKCICEAPSTYFEDWLGCRKCLEVHGAFSEQQYNAYVLQASAASSSMCEGTPTADIAKVFASAVPQGEPTGATSTKDQFPSDAAVSNYYKPKGEQGPGPTMTAADAPSETGATDGSDSSDSSDSSESESGSSNARTTDSGNSQATGAADSPSATETNSAAANAAPSSVFALAVAGAVLVAALGY